MAASKMSLKLLIDSKHNRVVFAEAGKDFVDFLLSLLALPVGTIIRLLTKSTMIGCIANLYGSIEKLDESYMQPNQNKDSILNPTVTTQVTNPSFLLPDTKEPENRKLYYCSNHPGPEGYVKGLVTYMVTDDLSVVSNVNGVPLLGLDLLKASPFVKGCSSPAVFPSKAALRTDDEKSLTVTSLYSFNDQKNPEKSSLCN
ncbi:hypothetical protein NC652_026548 [Populus alba x Populus x berolinensis]|nr:hypothetical protein NC652_026548 [Populus alba x Populus x berolinensis]